MAQDKFNPDETVRNALSVQVTEAGFNAIEGSVAGLVPGLLGDALVLDDIEVSAIGQSLRMEGMQPILDIRSIDLKPVTPGSISTGAQIDAEIVLDLSLNDANEPFYMEIDTIFGDCGGNDHYLNPLRVTAVASIEITYKRTEESFDIDVKLPSNAVTIPPGQINMSGDCDGTINFIGNLLIDVLVDAVVIPLVKPLLDEFEPQIAEALNAAVFVDSFEVLDSELFVELIPNQILTTPAGLELLYTSKFSAAQAACIADIDPLGSLRTNTPVPAIGDNPTGTQIAAYISDDMLNQAMYAVFAGGILCVDVDADLLGDSLPIPIDSSLIGLLGGEAYNEILPEVAQPLLIRTQPKRVPEVTFTGERPLTVQIDELGLGFYTEIEGRQAQVIGLDVAVDAGVDVVFDGTTGELGVDLGLAPEDFVITVSGDLFVPGTGPALVDAMSGLLETILPLVLDPLLGDLGFVLPALEGIGLKNIVLGPGGADQDWLRGEVEAGAVTYGAGGCDSGGADGGCGADCGGGCAQGGFGLGGYMLFFVPLWALRRRR